MSSTLIKRKSNPCYDPCNELEQHVGYKKRSESPSAAQMLQSFRDKPDEFPVCSSKKAIRVARAAYWIEKTFPVFYSQIHQANNFGIDDVSGIKALSKTSSLDLLIKKVALKTKQAIKTHWEDKIDKAKGSIQAGISDGLPFIFGILSVIPKVFRRSFNNGIVPREIFESIFQKSKKLMLQSLNILNPIQHRLLSILTGINDIDLLKRNDLDIESKISYAEDAFELDYHGDSKEQGDLEIFFNDHFIQQVKKSCDINKHEFTHLSDDEKELIGCPAGYAVSPNTYKKQSVVEEIFDWVENICKEYFFPHVEAIQERELATVS